MNAAKWMELKRVRGTHLSTPLIIDDRRTDGVREFLRGHVPEGMENPSLYLDKKRLGFEATRYSLCVLFPADFDMTGHIFYLRKMRDNVLVGSYRLIQEKNGAKLFDYAGTGFLHIRSKYVLRKLAELSPLFVPIWEDLKDVSSDAFGLYLAEAPDPGWLESILPNEARLFDAFLPGHGIAMGDMNTKENSRLVTRLLRMAIELYDSGMQRSADALFAELNDRGMWCWEYCNTYVRYLLDCFEPKLAYKEVQRAQEKYPSCLLLDKLGAMCCEVLCDHEGFDAHLARYREANPWDEQVMRGQARIAFREKHYRLAGELYAECMEHGTLPYADYGDYAGSFAYQHRFDEALALFENMPEEQRDGALLLNNLAMVLGGMGRMDKALEACRRALEIDPELKYPWDTLGFVYIKRGEPMEAIPVLRKALEMDDQYAEAWRHLLHAYDRAGQTEKLDGAKRWVEDILPDQLAQFERERGCELAE